MRISPIPCPWHGHRGTSACNGQTFRRGAPEDFATWAAWGNMEWSYKRVLPYVKQLENDADFRDALSCRSEYHRWNTVPSSCFDIFTRVCNRRCAPHLVHGIAASCRWI
jgi:choline dehydrogenase-like flavoprotein